MAERAPGTGGTHEKKQAGRQAGRQAGGQAGRQAGGQAGRQAYMPADSRHAGRRAGEPFGRRAKETSRQAAGGATCSSGMLFSRAMARTAGEVSTRSATSSPPMLPLVLGRSASRLPAPRAMVARRSIGR